MVSTCGGSSDAKSKRGVGRLDPAWTFRRRRTWQLDGLAPSSLINARTLAGQCMADAKRGNAKKIVVTITRENLDLEQTSALLAATDLADQNTALHLAAQNGHAEVCSLLLEHGADAFATNRQGHTAADLALAAGHTAVAGHVSLVQLGEAALFAPPSCFDAKAGVPVESAELLPEVKPETRTPAPTPTSPRPTATSAPPVPIGSCSPVTVRAMLGDSAMQAPATKASEKGAIFAAQFDFLFRAMGAIEETEATPDPDVGITPMTAQALAMQHVGAKVSM